MFKNYSDDFKKQEAEIAERKAANTINPVMVGTAPVKILAINPDQATLTELIGDVAERFDTRYGTSPDQYNDNLPARPLAFWITDLESKVSPTLINLRLIDTQRLSRDKKPQWWNAMVGDTWDMLTTRWSFDLNVGDSEDKISGSGNAYTNTILKPVNVGEENYYRLLYTLLKWPSVTTFMEAMKEAKLDFDTVYGGDFSGLHDLIDYINEPKKVEIDGEIVEQPHVKTFMGIFTAKIKDDGQVRQSFCVNPDTWFVNSADVLTKGMLARLDKLKKDRLDRDGMDIMKDRYTFEPLVEYSEEVVKQEITTNDDVDEWFTD